ncbi:MAG: hypothetical protein ACPGGE_00950 [Poseidonia sp.]
MRRVLQTTTEDGHFGPALFGRTRVTMSVATNFADPRERISLHVASTPSLQLPDATVLLSAEEARELADELLRMAKWAEGGGGITT